MLDVPKDVCFHENTLRWSPVVGADGYNIHLERQYFATVVGQGFTSFKYEGDTPEILRVSAWRRAEPEDEQGSKSRAATILLSPLTCDSSPDPLVPFIPLPPVQPVAPSSPGYDTRAELFVPTGELFEPPGELVFFDDFKTLDTGYWRPGFPYWGNETRINNELQDYNEDMIETGPYGLVLHAERVSDDFWLSGLISGNVDQSYTYGYFEARLRWNNTPGFLPAWWLLNEKYVNARPEFDIFESPGDGLAHHSYHHWTPKGYHNKHGNESPLITDEFVSYGFLWEPDAITWYINRIPMFTCWGDYIAKQGCYPILNLAAGGDWPGKPPADVSSAKLEVESMGIWRR